ncbi:titin isoform X2 [Cydia pomonella]|uniref:titin isoform X2 n=1 Tax=Cydia pomonella TaxID=82600 RepID=UPI002ADE65D4|nr:titin isoform X2 [Cydia pomonella]
MNSKKKNKNRQSKPPNPIPPQEQELSEPSSPLDVTNAEIESVVEERVPNIVSENASAEVKETEETPKKPKRNRGKKKIDDDKSVKEDEVKSEELVVGTEIQPVNESLDESNIAPTVRKKKNKNKKGQASTQGEKVEEIKVDKDAQIDESIGQTKNLEQSKVKEEPEQEIRSAKKKNKKKKSRNDSERSDKAEEVSCTSVFQKLLSESAKVEATTLPITKDTSVPEAAIKEVEISPQAFIPSDSVLKETPQKDEGNKNKKKNKKDKKPHAVPDANTQESHEIENVVISSNVSETSSEKIVKETPEYQESDETMPSCSTAGEKNSLKNKPKIAKPVGKKKQEKGNENIEKVVIEEVKVTQMESREETTIADVLPIEELDDVILVPLTDIAPDWQEEVKIEEGNGPVIGCEDKHDTIDLELECLSHENNTNRKTSPKPSRRTETIRSDGKSESEISSTSTETTVEKPAVNTDLKVVNTSEEKVGHQENKSKNIEVKDENKKRDKRKKSPRPTTHIERVPEIGISAATLCAMSKSVEISSKSLEQTGDLFEEKQDESKMSLIESGKIEVSGNDKNKSTNTSSKDEKATSSAKKEDIVQSELTPVGGPMLPAATSLDTVRMQTEMLFEVVQDEKKATEKDEVGRVNTPDNLKHHKRNKSPKPISVASGSKSSQKQKKNTLNIDDIIIIQAEVVSEEKAQKFSDSFIASEENTDKNDTIKADVKHGCEKPKKRKKSPKPSQQAFTQEMKCTTEKDCVLETQGEVQTPVTPKPLDVNLLPETFAVELETPKSDSLPSPNEVTPDFIEHPRCSSEQLDSNNNMVIQEIQNSDGNLSVPVIIPETPFIQSTNISSPELVSSGIRVIGTESDNKPLEEKTDLKSKVLEVNKDMEELRMSIERSLAELTSLEKSDKDAEKDVEKQNKEKDEMIKSFNLKQEIFIVENRPALEMLAVRKEDCKDAEEEVTTCKQPVCPARKDHKGKGKSKKKSKQESTIQSTSAQSPTNTTATEKSSQPENKNEEANKTEQSSSNTQGKEKQQASETKGNKDDDLMVSENIGKNYQIEFQPIENFEDAMTSSVDDVNKTFEIIATEANSRLNETQNNPEINVTAPQEDDKKSRQEKQNPISPPKNLLGHPDIPVPSSRTDYKKEKNKTPNCTQAKVKIKDANQVEIQIPKKFKESQAESKSKLLNFKKPDESISVTNQNEDYIYKYSFRKVFLQCACHVCKKDLKATRVPCSYCNLIFYCNQKHKDEDYSQHQALCFAVSTIVHLKDQKFIYADSRNVTGHNYRLLRMQMIVSCEKVLKRRLVPWEQEALLYPRMCALASCREWRQGKLVDCEGCGQISYCSEHPDHLSKSHSRWCKSYNLYRGLVKHQQTKGRLEPKLPTRVLEMSPLPENINEVLAAMYEQKIDMSDIEYAALTQLATAPLTALFCLQHRANAATGITKKTLTLHIVGAELQFEADVLNKWEVFLLHLLPNVDEIKVVLVGPDLNPSNLPLDLLGKIRYCENCQRNKRRVVFGFQDKRTYHEFWASDDFTVPDLVCAFNPSIQRSSAYNGKDTWPATINCILKLKSPLAITSYTLSELTSDLLRVQECATVRYNVLCAPRNNCFASVRPDRNFISDDEAPLLFKNYCVTVVCGA